MRTPLVRRVDRSESGYTLIELLVTMTILGSLMLAVSFAIGTSAHIQSTSAAQLDSAQWQTRLSYRIASDIESALAEGGVQADSHLSTFAACHSAATVLWIQTSDLSSGLPVLTEVEYKLTPSGDMIRVSCGALETRQSVIAQGVTSAVPTISTTTVVGPPPKSLVNRVLLKVTAVTKGISSDFTAAGVPRNPGVGTTGGGDLPPPVSGNASCTVLPTDVLFTNVDLSKTYTGMNPTNVVKIGRLTRRVKNAVVIQAKTSGTCDPPFVVQRQYTASSAILNYNAFFAPTTGVDYWWALAPNPGGSTVSWSGTISPGDGTWQETAGTSPNYAPMVLNDVNPPNSPLNDANVGSASPDTGSIRFVTGACHLDTAVVNGGAPFALNYRSRQSLVPLPVTITGPPNNYCDGAQIVFSQGVTPVNTSLATLTGGPTSWTGSIAVGTGVWSLTSEGGVAINAKAYEGIPTNADNESSPSTGFPAIATTTACKATLVGVDRLKVIAANGKLTSASGTFTITTGEPSIGSCGTLGLRLTGAGINDGGPVDTALSRISANQWQGTVLRSLPGAEKWQAGALTAEVFDGANFASGCCASAAAFTSAALVVSP